MLNEMTPLEAAEKLKWNAEHMFCNENLDDRESANACNTAASMLRAIAAGEYKQVVHGRLKEDCLNDSFYCPKCGKRARSTYACCPYCGCWFDGKDDSHEAD